MTIELTGYKSILIVPQNIQFTSHTFNSLVVFCVNNA